MKKISMLLCILLIFGLLTQAAAADAPEYWAEAEVSAAIELGLVPVSLQSGYMDNITREEFCILAVQMVQKLSGKKVADVLSELDLTVDSNKFCDASGQNILAANALGIVNGYSDGSFKPYNLITRQEAAAMLTRIASLFGVKNAIDNAYAGFIDGGKFDSWAIPYINFVSGTTDPTNGNRIMGGMPDGSFSPQSNYTRQQSYLTVARLYNAIVRKGEERQAQNEKSLYNPTDAELMELCSGIEICFINELRFSDPSEITSNELMCFYYILLSEEEANAFFDSATGMYTFTPDDVKAVLNRRIEGYDFTPENVTSYAEYHSDTNSFTAMMMGGFGGYVEMSIVSRTTTDNQLTFVARKAVGTGAYKDIQYSLLLTETGFKLLSVINI